MTYHVGLRSDFEGWEIGVAIVVAIGIQIGAGIALHAAQLDIKALAPPIEKGTETPVAVKPVLDLDSPLLKFGSKKKYKLPDQWVRQAPKKRVVRKTHVSTKAKKTAEDIPDEDIPMADAGEEPPDPDAEFIKEQDTEFDETDAGEAKTDEEGHADGVVGGTEMDPLKARAIDLYRARIAGFFTSAFSVHGTGLSQEQLEALAASASVQLNGLTVQSFTLNPSGNAQFDAAARTALQSRVGQQIPPPPENYPDAMQNQISLTFVCRNNRCD